MKQKSENAMQTAGELLAERRKFEAWLAALDDRRSSTPDHVFTRVRADYAARLEAVVSQLRSKAEVLEGRFGELTQRVTSLETEAQAVQDERAEAELRAAVGELEPSAWDTAAKDADARLESLMEDRRAVEEELSSIRQLLDSARSPTPAQAAEAQAAPEEHDSSAGDALDVIGAAGARAEREIQGDAFAPEPQSSSSPETSMPTADAPEDAAGGDAPLVSEGPASKRTAAGFDELAFLRDVAGTQEEASRRAEALPNQPSTRKSGERPIDDSLGLVLPDDSPAYAPPRRQSTETPMAANVPGNSPIIIQGESRQTKTLKCTDCGSMNYPTEWYCERCGAELSAL